MKKPLALTDNELAQEYAATYARLAAQFVDLFERIEAVDKEISRINGLAPSGEHRRLRQVELVARGLDNFSRADPPITKAVQLPDRTNSEKMVWPPPQPSLAAVFAMSMVPSTLHGRSSRWSATAIATPRNAQGALDAGRGKAGSRFDRRG